MENVCQYHLLGLTGNVNTQTFESALDYFISQIYFHFKQSMKEKLFLKFWPGMYFGVCIEWENTFNR